MIYWEKKEIGRRTPRRPAAPRTPRTIVAAVRRATIARAVARTTVAIIRMHWVQQRRRPSRRLIVENAAWVTPFGVRRAHSWVSQPLSPVRSKWCWRCKTTCREMNESIIITTSTSKEKISVLIGVTTYIFSRVDSFLKAIEAILHLHGFLFFSSLWYFASSVLFSIPES
jgi:hypothetical protein